MVRAPQPSEPSRSRLKMMGNMSSLRCEIRLRKLRERSKGIAKRNARVSLSCFCEGEGCGDEDAVLGTVWMLITTVAPFAPGTVKLGEKLAVEPACKPDTLKVTLPVNAPPCEETSRG